MNKAGHVYTVARGKSSMIGAYKIETEVINGNGKFEKTGVTSDREAKEAIETSFKYFRANAKNISGTISVANRDYMMHVQDIGGIGLTSELSLAAFVGLCSGAMSSAVDLPTVPPELFAKFQTSFYTSPEDAVFKALGVD